jgi:hypothetical protein
VLILGAVRGAGQGQRMLDDAGLPVPRFMASADAVADAVVRVVAKDRAELVVMPGPGRLLRAVMDYFPGLGPAMNDALGARTSMEQLLERRASRPDPTSVHADTAPAEPAV